MMHPTRVVAAIGQILRLFSLTLLIPIPFALLYEPWNVRIIGPIAVPHNALVFLASFALVIALWLTIRMLTRKVDLDELQEREAYLTVGLAWIVLAVVAMVPFLLSRVILDPVDAFFEAMSGITTTGATILEGELELVPRSVMLWRGLLQYIGGMGIIVLGVALLARLTSGGMQLLQAEASGPTISRVRPKLAQTAKSLWGIYATFSALVFAILFALFTIHQRMPLGDAFYDAVLHTFTSISSGGFSNHSASIAHYGSWLIEGFLILVMLVAAMNFTLHYHLLHGHWQRMWRDPEWRFFLLAFFGFTFAVTGLVWQAGQGFVEALQGAGFTVASLLTSTGYATADYDTWPDAAKIILFVIMFTGGSAGSTSGGMKVIRILIFLKLIRRAVQKILHPRAVIPIRLGRVPLKDETLWTVVTFFFLYITIWMVATIVVVATDPALNMVDGASAAVSAISNMGPAMGVVGPTETYATLLPSTKALLGLLMWAGRLELLAVILIFTRDAWKN